MIVNLLKKIRNTRILSKTLETNKNQIVVRIVPEIKIKKTKRDTQKILKMCN